MIEIIVYCKYEMCLGLFLFFVMIQITFEFIKRHSVHIWFLLIDMFICGFKV